MNARTPVPGGPRAWRAIGGVAAAACAVITLAAAPQDATLTIDVVDDAGRPVAGAQVTLSIGTRPVRVESTDPAGRLVLGTLQGGAYSLDLSKPGHASVRFGAPLPDTPGVTIPMAAGQQRTVRARLPRGAVISGSVLDEEGHAIPGATVTALRETAAAGEPSSIGSDVTDSQGTYRIFDLASGSYSIRVSAPFADAGRILRGDGFEEVHPDRYYPDALAARSAGRVRVTPAEIATGIDVTLSPVPAADVTGFVVAPDATALPPLFVEWLAPADAAGPGPNSDRVRTEPSGAFALPGVTAGPRVIRTSLLGRAAGQSEPARPDLYGWAEVIVSGRAVATSFTLRPAATISGRYALAGPPPPAEALAAGPDLVARAGPFADVAARRMARESSAAGFRYTGVAPGEYSFAWPSLPAPWSLVSAELDGRDLADGGLTIEAGTIIDTIVITLSDRSTTIAGTVTGSRAVAAYERPIVVFPANRVLRTPGSRRIRVAPTDVDGRYQIAGLPPGRYLVTAATLDFDPRVEPARLTSLEIGARAVTLDAGGRVVVDFGG
jgi:hypothetical protein